ncbi:MAG: hypothetical protein AB1813_27090, partial [Verrucomicrobiota bacterium]
MILRSSLCLMLMAVLCSREMTGAQTIDPKPFSTDLSHWPNQVSRANSDRWLVENHDRIRRMHPRLLVLNFSNEASRDKLEQMLRELITAVGEGSRYHGYKNPDAPVFLACEVFKFVDLRD